MAKPGTPSGVNHSSESQTCGRKRSPDSSSSKCRRRTRSSSGVPSMRTGRSERRSPSSSSSVTPSQSNFLLNAVPIVSIRSGGLAQVLVIRLGGDQMGSAAEEEVVAEDDVVGQLVKALKDEDERARPQALREYGAGGDACRLGDLRELVEEEAVARHRVGDARAREHG